MGDRVQEAKEEGIRQGIMLKEDKIAELLKDNPNEK